MSNNFWLALVIFAIVLAGMIGIYLYQKSKVEAQQVTADKLAIINASLSGSLKSGTQSFGAGSWFNSLLTGVLNSGGVTAFGAGAGKALPALI